MIWRNGEHYCDPTAGAALQSIAHKEVCSNMMEGKRFERDFKASVPLDTWCYRLRDSPISYYGGSEAEGIRFAQDNICDFFLFRAPSLYLLELKTVGTRSAALTSLFGGMLIVAGFALDYLAGRADEREHYRLEEKPAIPMEHVHGGDPDDL